MAGIPTEVHLWSEELLGPAVVVRPLSGGANNFLYHCKSRERELVIKRYRQNEIAEISTRRQSEVAFLKHAAQTAPRFVPELLEVSDRNEMIAMSYVAGMQCPLGAGVSTTDVNALTEFYRLINSDHDSVLDYPIKAKEGFMSVSGHLEHIKKRIISLSVSHLPAGISKKARVALSVLNHRFQIAAKCVARSLETGPVTDRLPACHQQLSPGDFGFHNAIKLHDRRVFLDFEYAGVDDPAKTLVDLFLQPKVPLNRHFWGTVSKTLAISLPLEQLWLRAAVLEPLMLVKWGAIILAPLDIERFMHFQAKFGKDAISEISRRLQAFDNLPFER